MKSLVIILMALLSVFSIQAENRSLIVGVGKYKIGTGWSEIHGDSDADLLSSALRKKGYNDIVVLKNSQATKAAIIKELKALATRCKPGDKVYFHFSGHGQPVTDHNQDEGDKGFDEAIVPFDAYKTITSRVGNRFYNGENHLTDDELNPLFADIKDKLGPDGAFFIAIDACYSDDMERAPGDGDGSDTPTRGTSDKLKIKKTEAAAKIPKPKTFSKGARMYVVSACKSDERNFEYRASDGRLYGSLSFFIFCLMDQTTDYGKWADGVRLKKCNQPGIFKIYQHPQIQQYK